MIEIKKIEHNNLKDLSSLLKELSGKSTDINFMLRNLEWMETNRDYFVLGAEYKRRLVGFLMGMLCYELDEECKPFMAVENVIVAKKYRGQGIGKKLMLKIEEIGKARNCYYIMIVPEAQRKEAYPFYESLGYPLDAVQGFKKYLG